MKNPFVRNLAAVGLFSVLAACSVVAQTSSRVEANVPFDFTAGTANVKAGALSVKRLSNNSLAIRGADGNAKALINAPVTIGARDSKAGERLVFNKYGDQYFLTQIWMSAETGRQLFTSAAEARAARQYRLAHKNAVPEKIEIALR